MSIGREPAAGRSPQERAACSRSEGTSPAVSPTPGRKAPARRRNVRPSPRLHPRISPTGRRALSPGPSGDARPVPRTVPTCGTSQYGRIASKCVWLPWTGRPQDSRMGGIGHGGCWRGCPRDGSGGVRTVIESLSPGPANRGSARDSTSRSARSSSRDAAHSAPCRSASPPRRRSSASARSLAATMRPPRSSRLAGRGPRRAPAGICGAGRPLRGGADGSGAGARDRRSEVFRTKRLESIRDSATGAARGHARPIAPIALDSS